MPDLPVSVLMPVFNCGLFLDEAIDSICRQTLLDWELVIVNDGSTDNSLAVIRKHAQADRRIVVVEQANLGIANALNAGLARCRGTFVARMDGDDISFPNRLIRQISHLKRHGELSAIGSYAKTMSGHLANHGVIRYPLTPAAISLSLVTGVPILHPTSMIRRDVLERQAGWRNEWAEDHDLWCRMIKQNDLLANVPQYLLYYRTHKSNHSKISYHLETVIERGRAYASWLSGSHVDAVPYAAFARVVHGRSPSLDDDAPAFVDLCFGLRKAVLDRYGKRRFNSVNGVLASWVLFALEQVAATGAGRRTRILLSRAFFSMMPFQTRLTPHLLRRLSKTCLSA